MKRIASPALAVAIAIALTACGGGDNGNEPAKAPKSGQPSAQLKVPLPSGAVSAPAGDAGGEAYRVADSRLLDINAFYERETDGKALRDFAWCGASRFSETTIVRIWKKDETNQLRVELVSDKKGVLIKMREQADAQPTACPPEGPAGDPFEAP